MLYKKAVQIKRAWDTGFYYRTNKNNWRDGTDTVPEALRTAWDNMGLPTSGVQVSRWWVPPHIW